VSIQVSTDARIAETEDGYYLDAIVLNRLPCVSVPALKLLCFLIPHQMLPADEVSVVLLGRDSERSQFVLAIQGLAPGKTPLTMFCPVRSLSVDDQPSSQRIPYQDISSRYIHIRIERSALGAVVTSANTLERTHSPNGSISEGQPSSVSADAYRFTCSGCSP
jgi:hypothetical protein